MTVANSKIATIASELMYSDGHRNTKCDHRTRRHNLLNFMYFPAIALLAGTLVGLGTPVSADNRDAAMVLDVTAPTTPATEPFAMLPGETVLTLDPDGEIELVHLGSCELIRVKGGNVEISEFGIDVTGDELLRSDDECPEEARLKGETTTGGVTLREGETVLIPARPVLVLAQAAKSVTLGTQDSKIILHKWQPAGRVLSWPENAAPLPGKTRFLLTVQFSEKSAGYAVLLVDPDGGKHRLPVLLGGD